jgi:hypothetical protein
MDRADLIRRAAQDGVCPQCGVALDNNRVGSGRLADGVFCSLGCMTTFHEDYYRERLDFGLPSDN